jgi:hypothetical protein
LSIIFIQRFGPIQHNKRKIGIRNLLQGSTHSDVFNDICSLSDTGSVREIKRDAIETYGLCYNVTCSTRNVAYDRTIPGNEAVEQAGFSDIRPTENCQPKTMG